MCPDNAALLQRPISSSSQPCAPLRAGVRYVRSGLVHTLLTLGTPHASIEAYPFGRAQVGPRSNQCAACVSAVIHGASTLLLCFMLLVPGGGCRRC